MRLPIPSVVVARAVRRLAGASAAGAGAEPRLRAVRIYPRTIEIALEQPSGSMEEVCVVPRGAGRWALLALAPLLFVTIEPRARLHARIGGLPYSIDALLTTARKHRRRAGAGASTSTSSRAGAGSAE